MSHKKHIITICIILLIVTTLGVFWYTQKNTVIPVNTEIQKEVQHEKEILLPNIEDWKEAEWITYQDVENGFEFQYPDTFILRYNSLNERQKKNNIYLSHIDTERYVNEWSTINDGPIQLMLAIEVSIWNNENKYSLIEWFDVYKEKDIEYTRIEKYQVDNRDVLRVSENSIQSNDAIYFLFNNKIIEFHLQGSSIDELHVGFFVKILKSFREI